MYIRIKQKQIKFDISFVNALLIRFVVYLISLPLFIGIISKTTSVFNDLFFFFVAVLNLLCVVHLCFLLQLSPLVVSVLKPSATMASDPYDRLLEDWKTLEKEFEDMEVGAHNFYNC